MPRKDKVKNAEDFRRWYAKNKDVQLARVKQQQQKIFEEVVNYKESNPCSDCGKKYAHYVMDFDHISDDKKKNVSSLAKRGSRKQVWEEIEKCELVCSNCHRERTHNRR
jgi:predicted RNA-binding protein